jgi:hypothetical protein
MYSGAEISLGIGGLGIVSGLPTIDELALVITRRFFSTNWSAIRSCADPTSRSTFPWNEKSAR